MKSGFISVIGRPNVGKSTLLNKIVGQKLTITSNKPQTTRNKITCIYTTDEGQAVFLDTPGIHKPAHKLDEHMMEEVTDAMSGIDLTIVMVEPGRPHEDDLSAVAMAKRSRAKKILVINKIDSVPIEKTAETAKTYQDMGCFDEIVPVSAFVGTNVKELIRVIFDYLPQGQYFFPEDMVTDQPEKVLCAEFIREKALYVLSHEIPHGIAVVIDQFKERPRQNLVDIDATIICERESHKPIIIGKHGATIKEIGSQARVEIEKMLGIQVNLRLWVKVKERWRDSEVAVRNYSRQD